MVYSIDLIQRIEELARQLTPPTEISYLLDINEDQLKLDLNTHGSNVRRAFYRGLSTTANELRCNNIELANAGSPAAVASCISDFKQMLVDIA